MNLTHGKYSVYRPHENHFELQRLALYGTDGRHPTPIKGVEQNLEQYKPDVIVLNSGDARVLHNEPIIMGEKDVYEVYKAARSATIITSHMEAVNHATLSRKDLRAFLLEQGMTSRVLVPEDGESYNF